MLIFSLLCFLLCFCLCLFTPFFKIFAPVHSFDYQKFLLYPYFHSNFTLVSFQAYFLGFNYIFYIEVNYI